MKKRFSVIIALILVLAVALPVIASCTKEKDVSSIAVVNPKTTFEVGDAIDYDNLQIKVTFTDNSTETKTIKALKATVVKADLSKAGNSSYTVSYQGKTATVNIVVEDKTPPAPVKLQPTVFAEPDFYTEYRTRSANTEGEETRADFRTKGETYEVGNVNKFIFRPTAKALDISKGEVITINNVKTSVKVYSKDSKAGTYAELTGDNLTNFVAIEDNTYKFATEAAGKYVKMEISIDAEEYDVSAIEEENRTITVELVVVDGGYNAYNQLGLSVISDMQKQAWADLWGATATWNASESAYVLSAKQDATPVKLEADDEPLYTYVGNVKCIVLHGSISLNADQMPATYFWNGTEAEYNTAYASLNGLPDMQAKLIGSLRDGENGNNYYRVTDMIPETTQSSDTLIWLNMQKGLFATSKVSVSGNYNSIIVPETESENHRTFTTVVDWGNDSESKPADPVPHWAIFQIYMKNDQTGFDMQYDIKNLAMSGNTSKENIDADTKAKGLPAGMMMVNCYTNHLTFDNVVSEKFFTNIVVDGYGDHTGVDILNTKMYDSYSNMCYMWRSKINIENSELIGAGGPLFILCDGDNHFISGNHTDDQGSNLVVDATSKLESFATGQESWYAIYNAQPLVGQLKSQLDPALKNFHKTIVSVQNSQEYVNVIAAIICSPSSLMSGNSENLIDVCGTYTTKDSEGNVVEEFKMHNQMLVALRASVLNDAKLFPMILQTGNLFTFTDGTNFYTLGASGQQPFNPQTDGVAWATDTHNKLAVYMSAATLSHSSMAPYFGVILDIYPYQAAN